MRSANDRLLHCVESLSSRSRQRPSRNRLVFEDRRRQRLAPSMSISFLLSRSRSLRGGRHRRSFPYLKRARHRVTRLNCGAARGDGPICRPPASVRAARPHHGWRCDSGLSENATAMNETSSTNAAAAAPVSQPGRSAPARAERRHRRLVRGKHSVARVAWSDARRASRGPPAELRSFG